MPTEPRRKPQQRNPQPYRAMTLDAVAQEMDISREGVRKIEISALAKLRRALEERGVHRESLAAEPMDSETPLSWREQPDAEC